MSKGKIAIVLAIGMWFHLTGCAPVASTRRGMQSTAHEKALSERSHPSLEERNQERSESRQSGTWWWTTNLTVASFPPMQILTNVIDIMESVVEVRCVVLVGLLGLEPASQPVDWPKLMRESELVSDCFREELSAMLCQNSAGIPLEDAITVVGLSALRRGRGYAQALYAGKCGAPSRLEDVPFSDLVHERMSEAERRLFFVACSRMKSLMHDELTALLLAMAEHAPMAMTSNHIVDCLALFGRRNPADGHGNQATAP